LLKKKKEEKLKTENFFRPLWYCFKLRLIWPTVSSKKKKKKKMKKKKKEEDEEEEESCYPNWVIFDPT
jgi:hypothetical protein